MAARLMAAKGFKVIGIVEYDGAVFNAKGLDIQQLMAHRKATGSISGFSEGEDVDKDEALLRSARSSFPPPARMSSLPATPPKSKRKSCAKAPTALLRLSRLNTRRKQSLRHPRYSRQRRRRYSLLF